MKKNHKYQMYLNQRALTIQFNVYPTCYILSFKGSWAAKLRYVL